MNTVDLTRFSPKWQFRFNFFEQHGAPNSPTFKAAYKTLPFGQKIKVNFNLFCACRKVVDIDAAVSPTCGLDVKRERLGRRGK